MKCKGTSMEDCSQRQGDEKAVKWRERIIWKTFAQLSFSLIVISCLDCYNSLLCATHTVLFQIECHKYSIKYQHMTRYSSMFSSPQIDRWRQRESTEEGKRENYRQFSIKQQQQHVSVCVYTILFLAWLSFMLENIPTFSCTRIQMYSDTENTPTTLSL